LTAKLLVVREVSQSAADVATAIQGHPRPKVTRVKTAGRRLYECSLETTLSKGQGGVTRRELALVVYETGTAFPDKTNELAVSLEDTMLQFSTCIAPIYARCVLY
jgi:hypothetical protein